MVMLRTGKYYREERFQGMKLVTTWINIHTRYYIAGRLPVDYPTFNGHSNPMSPGLKSSYPGEGELVSCTKDQSGPFQ